MAKRRKRTNSKVPAKGRLRDMADQLWSKAVKADWSHKCAICGRGDSLNSHHLIPRTHQATRYLLRNGISLCKHHHVFCNDRSPHGNGMGFVLWLDANHLALGEWVFEMLDNGDHRKFNGTTNAAYYIDIILGLREYVDEDEYSSIVGVKFGQYLDQLERDE
jgi:hypothetical protein